MTRNLNNVWLLCSLLPLKALSFLRHFLFWDQKDQAVLSPLKSIKKIVEIWPQNVVRKAQSCLILRQCYLPFWNLACKLYKHQTCNLTYKLTTYNLLTTAVSSKILIVSTESCFFGSSLVALTKGKRRLK